VDNFTYQILFFITHTQTLVGFIGGKVALLYMSLPRRAMEQMGFAICCLSCDAPDIAGSQRCKSCISSHVKVRDKISSGPATTKADRLSREFVTMLANPSDFIENSEHSETMVYYKSLIDIHQGTSQPKTAEEVQQRFEAQRQKKERSLIRDVASNRKRSSEVLGAKEIEELLSKISDKPTEESDSFWEELLDDVNELFEED
tara:strand:- start:2380 stop:2985 length:606 start_codon:yes stop_codon:yes gene_type:complete